jgi:hypothetical protein
MPRGGRAPSKSSLCEDCGLKQPNFGLLAEGKRCWCAGCAKQQPLAVDLTNKRCEDCQRKVATWGVVAEDGRNRRGRCRHYASPRSLRCIEVSIPTHASR